MPRPHAQSLKKQAMAPGAGRCAPIWRLVLACLFAVFRPDMSMAQMVRDCDTFEANARNLAFPYEDATRTFANGDISLLSLFLEEPACCGAHLMVLVTGPNADQISPDCNLVSLDASAGFGSIDLKRAKASYDPTSGLSVFLPATAFKNDRMLPVELQLTINRAVGSIETSLAPLE